MTQDSTASTSMSNAFSSPLQFTPSTSQPTTPKPGQQAQAPAPAPQPQPQQAQPAQPASDPFAIFNSTPKPAAQAAAPAPAEDDEWNFTSSLPAETNSRPKEQKSTISDGAVRAEFLANRNPATSNAINMVFSFSNNTAQPISEFHFQLAVTKVFTPPPKTLIIVIIIINISLTFVLSGLRAPTPTPNRPRPLAKAKQRNNTASSSLARLQPQPKSRVGKTPMARGV